MDWVGDKSRLFSVKIDRDTGDCVKRCWCLSGATKTAGEQCLFISQITDLLSSQISSGDVGLGRGLLHPILFRISSKDFTSKTCLTVTGLVDDNCKIISNKTQYLALMNQTSAVSFYFSFSLFLFPYLCLSLSSYFSLYASSKNFFFLLKKVDPSCKYIGEVQEPRSN